MEDGVRSMELKPDKISNSLDQIKERIKKACQKSGRNSSEITILGITKLHPAEAIIESLRLGITDIGESYVQEALSKIEAVKQILTESEFKKINWHFVGGLQSNKIKYLKDDFSFIHSIDSQKQLLELDKRMLNGIKVFFELNIADEKAKGGVKTKDLKNLIDKLLEINVQRTKLEKPMISPMGLMCLPPAEQDPELSRPYFKALKNTLIEMNNVFNLNMGCLSMGMSSDFDVAIEEGASHIRIGTLLYGEREYKKA